MGTCMLHYSVLSARCASWSNAPARRWMVFAVGASLCFRYRSEDGVSRRRSCCSPETVERGKGTLLFSVVWPQERCAEQMSCAGRVFSCACCGRGVAPHAPPRFRLLSFAKLDMLFFLLEFTQREHTHSQLCNVGPECTQTPVIVAQASHNS